MHGYRSGALDGSTPFTPRAWRWVGLATACRPRRISSSRQRTPRRAMRCMPAQCRRVAGRPPGERLGRASQCTARRPTAATFLLRPDLGRRLRDRIAQVPCLPGAMLFVVCDGLSAIAAQRHARGAAAAQLHPALSAQVRSRRSSSPSRAASRSVTTSARRWAPRPSPC